MPDVWGDDDKYARRVVKHRKARKARRRKGTHRKAGGCLTALVPLMLLDPVDEPTWKKIGCGTSLLLWAAVLVPLILWGPL